MLLGIGRQWWRASQGSLVRPCIGDQVVDRQPPGQVPPAQMTRSSSRWPRPTRPTARAWSRVWWRETGAKPERRTRPDRTAGGRVFAAQSGCGRDRIRTCVGNAGDFPASSTTSSGIPTRRRPRGGASRRSTVRRRLSGRPARRGAPTGRPSVVEGVLSSPARAGVLRRSAFAGRAPTLVDQDQRVGVRGEPGPAVDNALATRRHGLARPRLARCPGARATGSMGP